MDVGISRQTRALAAEYAPTLQVNMKISIRDQNYPEAAG
jgi:hypothetical protein